MIVYRISKAAYAGDLGGMGARMYGARWNHKGVPLLYTASGPALATVEFFVHVDTSLVLRNLRLVFIELPDTASSHTIDRDSLPADWRTFPAPPTLAEIGTRWAFSQQTLLLRVPSAVVVDDENVLVNPAHPEFAAVRFRKDVPYGFDERLIQRVRKP